MTIKKRLFYYNLLMVVIPILAMLVIVPLSVYMVKSIFYMDTDKVDQVNESFLKMMSIMNESDINGIAEDPDAQKELMDRFEDKHYFVYAKQDEQTLFTNMGEEEYSYISKFLSQDHLYTAGDTLWVLDDDLYLWWNRIETDTTPITLVVTRFTDRIDGTGHTVAFATITLLILLSIVFMLILISLYFANKMIRKIMVPLNELCAGARRIQMGDLSQDIACPGDGELEEVCASFNEMQRQLKENLKKNEKYERDRNEMLAGISHDLRTPLTSIKSYVKGLQDDIAKTPDKQKEYLDVVYRKACGIESLINSLFLFSKLESDTFPYQFKKVSVQNFMVTLLDSLEYDLKKNNATLTLKSSCTTQKVRMDSDQMTRVITNILDNSLKYNPNKALHITVTMFERNGRVVIAIQDDGAGVSPEQLGRLFDGFYRGDESRNHATEGSGLGLTIAKRIVTASGGSISAESDNGLTIIIELPVEEEQHNEERINR